MQKSYAEEARSRRMSVIADRPKDADRWLKVIEDWFKVRCDGLWEHRFGFSLETTDNPGWWASFQLYTTEAEANLILADSPHREEVDLSVENGHIRVYSESLSNCLEACALIMAGAEQSLEKTRADVAANESIQILIGWIEEGEHPRLCDEGEFSEVDVEVSNALCLLGYTNSTKFLSKKTFEFDLDAVSPTKSYSTTLILIRSLPIRLVELSCPRTGLAVYVQRGDNFVLESSACKFHEDGKIAVKSACDEQGIGEIRYWVKIRDILMAELVNVVLQK